MGPVDGEMPTTQSFYVSAPDLSTSQYYAPAPYTTDIMGYHTFYAPNYATTSATTAGGGAVPPGAEYGTATLQTQGDQGATSMNAIGPAPPAGVAYAAGGAGGLLGHGYANGMQQPGQPLHNHQHQQHQQQAQQQQQQQQAQQQYPWAAEEPAEYARTLIGPLAASAQTLTDDHDEPGIFFLFQDLSVRTEGTFRLRMRLVNVGGPPAPEMGASHVKNGNSTVLAQVFTNPFIVFSAKKFPGVPSPTALSQRLLQQGLKIPGRARPNAKNPTSSRKTKRRKTEVGEGEWLGSGSGAASNASDSDD
ncbi:hypothetical protein FRC19_001058 [Serendipita sp. 401]|nr:hypothetical protein FRC19_001058 [Serendipita sp. 401]